MATPLDEARSNLLDPRNLTGRAEGYHWVQRVDAQLVAEFEARVRLDEKGSYHGQNCMGSVGGPGCVCQ